MGDRSGISWCGPTWNPWVGCVKKSAGCAQCYMYRDMGRYGQDPRIVRRTAPATFNRPLKWAREVEAGKRNGIDRVVFTCSWSDFFNPEADEWRPDAWDIIRRTTPALKYLILTKLPERIFEHLPADWGRGWPGAGLGTSVENREALWRVNPLRSVEADMKFLSLEPLLEDMGAASFSEFDWLLIGGESGTDARPYNPRWGDVIADRAAAGVYSKMGDIAGDPVVIHTKQMGSNCRNDLGERIRFKHPHGADPSEWLESRRVQDFPAGWIEDAPDKQEELF